MFLSPLTLPVLPSSGTTVSQINMLYHTLYVICTTIFCSLPQTVYHHLLPSVKSSPGLHPVTTDLSAYISHPHHYVTHSHSITSVIDQSGSFLGILKSVCRLFHRFSPIFFVKRASNCEEIPNFHKVIHIDSLVIS